MKSKFGSCTGKLAPGRPAGFTSVENAPEYPLDALGSVSITQISKIRPNGGKPVWLIWGSPVKLIINQLPIEKPSAPLVKPED